MTLRVTVLGSTGSIGVNTLDVMARHPGRFEVFALSAATRVDPLFAQCVLHRPRYAVMTDAARARELRERLRTAGLATEVLSGAAALDEVAAHLDQHRRAALYDEICALGAQALMTGTEPGLFDSLGSRAQSFTVAEDGGMSKVSPS